MNYLRVGRIVIWALAFCLVDITIPKITAGQKIALAIIFYTADYASEAYPDEWI